MSGPELTIVIPVYNEAEILEDSVFALKSQLEEAGLAFEILLAENGSRDATVRLAAALHEDDPRVRWFSHPEPNYGGALREGIERAAGEFVICEEIDLCDVDFHRRALELLRSGEAEMVVGSKAMPGARDHRPVFRRVATRVYNGVLRLILGFRGTDTHGLKAFRREVLAPIAKQCVVEHDVFASEFVLRAWKRGVRVIEIPVDVEEKRAPSIRLLRRIPKVLSNLRLLRKSLRDAGAPPDA